MLRAGQLTTLVVIEHKTRERDDLEKLPERWEEFAAVWCEPVEAGDTESQPNAQTVAAVVWKFRTHWFPLLDQVRPTMRARVDGRVLEIRSAINEQMANRSMLITCVEAQ